MLNEERFGFAHPENLITWFEGWFEELDRRGFVVAEYKVQDDHVRHGKAQSVFIYDTAVRTNEFSVIDFRRNRG